jgi:hypothetical protein
MDELKTLLLEERESIGDLSGVPFVVFPYDPNKELKMENEHIDWLLEKLEFEDVEVAKVDMRDHFFSLLEKKGRLDRAIEVEKERGTEEVSESLNGLLYEEVDGKGALIQELLEEIEGCEVAVIYRTGILYPFTSISVIFQRLENVVEVPIVVFYPADNEDGVRFMGETESSYYREKVI